MKVPEEWLSYSKTTYDQATGEEVTYHTRFPDVVDSTMLLTASCPIKFFYQFCMGLSPSQKSIHLHAGGAFAHAVERVRKAFYLEKKELRESLYDGWRAFIDYWGDYPDAMGTYKDFYNVSAALFDYFHTYNPTTDHIQPYIKQDGTPAVEFTFAIPLPIIHPTSGLPLIYSGRCDMVGTYQQSSIAIVDEKTTYAISEDASKNFAMRGQFLGYTWAAQQAGMPASMCVVRQIGIQQRAIKHLESIIQFPQWQVDLWYEEMLLKAQKLVDCWNTREFPLNFGNECSSYGGCASMDLCTSHQPENWFDSYEVRQWNPLDVSMSSAS